mmetsp:Transcript_9529/g.24172  ORF Transcript_9529/g.24172 Transcript_9529/m.24172 type:complete len:234 (+) Transcript_9529:620-1321(+)
MLWRAASESSLRATELGLQGFHRVSFQQALSIGNIDQPGNQLHHVRPVHGGRLVDQIRHRGLRRPDDVVVPQVRKHRHQHLAVAPVRHAAVAGDAVAKVLDLEGALEAAGKEAAERPDQRRKHSQRARMQLDGLRGEADRLDVLDEPARDPWLPREVGDRLQDDVGHPGVEVVDGEAARLIQGVVLAVERAQDGEILTRAGEPLVLPQEGRQEEGAHDGAQRATDEALPCLFR